MTRHRPPRGTITSLDPGEDFGLQSVACASATQCTATSSTKEVTFNPASPAGATPVTLGAKLELGRVVCPAATQCTAVQSDGGGEVTFNPQAPAPGTPVTIDNEEFNVLFDLACPSATQCTTTSQGGRTITFNPQTGEAQPFLIDKSPGGSAIGQETGITALACLSSASCVAADGAGRVLAFDPVAPGSPKATQIDVGGSLLGVACPSTTQCTAIDFAREMTFNPFKPGTPKQHQVFKKSSGLGLTAVACQLTTRCTIARLQSQATFNPRAFKQPASHTLDGGGGDQSIVALRCPSRTECVVIDSFGQAFTFNPANAKLLRRAINVEKGEAQTALACPSAKQCTAVDNDGMAITFQPLTGKRIAGAKIDKPVGLDAPSGDSDDELDGVACKGTRLCVAVDTLGNVIRFDPHSTTGGQLRSVDTGPCADRRGLPVGHAVPARRRGRAHPHRQPPQRRLDGHHAAGRRLADRRHLPADHLCGSRRRRQRVRRSQLTRAWRAAPPAGARSGRRALGLGAPRAAAPTTAGRTHRSATLRLRFLQPLRSRQRYG